MTQRSSASRSILGVLTGLRWELRGSLVRRPLNSSASSALDHRGPPAQPRFLERVGVAVDVVSERETPGPAQQPLLFERPLRSPTSMASSTLNHITGVGGVSGGGPRGFAQNAAPSSSLR